MTKLKKGRYSNGTEMFYVQEIQEKSFDGEEIQKAELSTQTGVTFLRTKKNNNTIVGVKDIANFLDDEMRDFHYEE